MDVGVVVGLEGKAAVALTDQRESWEALVLGTRKVIFFSFLVFAVNTDAVFDG